MSAHGRRRYQEEGQFCIPGLGDRQYRPGATTQPPQLDLLSVSDVTFLKTHPSLSEEIKILVTFPM